MSADQIIFSGATIESIVALLSHKDVVALVAVEFIVTCSNRIGDVR